MTNTKKIITNIDTNGKGPVIDDPQDRDCMLNCIVEKIESFFESADFERIKPVGLVDSTFPHTFNPSAAHGIVRECIKPSFSSYLSGYVIERCVRDVDLHRIGDGLHTLFFEMPAFVIACRYEELKRESIIYTSLDLLKSLGMSLRDLRFTVFNGAKIDDRIFRPDSLTTRILLNYGILKEQIHSINGLNNFIYLRKDGDAAGQRCELYHNIGTKRSPVFIEVASIIFENYYFQKGKLFQSPNYVAGAAFGLERLAMVQEKKRDIQSINCFYPLKEEVEQLIGHDNSFILREQAVVLQELSKALVFILWEGLTRDLSRRVKIVDRYRNLFNKVCELNGVIPQTAFSRLALKVSSCYMSRYPELSEETKDIIAAFKTW